MGAAFCRLLAFVALSAGCAKGHVEKTSPTGAPASAATTTPAADRADGDAIDWATVKPGAHPAPPCVRFAATGNYHVCLAADRFGCIHYGDFCEPSKPASSK